MHFLELTYWQDATVPVPVFCCFSIPDNYLRKYSWNWTKQKPSFLFSRHVHGVQRGEGGGPWAALTMPWRGWALGRAATWWGALGSQPTIVLSPIYCPRRENPKIISHIPQRGSQRRRHPEQVSGDRTLCSGTLPGRGSAPGAISIDSTAIFIAVVDSHDEEGVVLPRGRGLYRELCGLSLSPMVWSLCDHELCNLDVVMLFKWILLMWSPETPCPTCVKVTVCARVGLLGYISQNTYSLLWIA